MTFSEVSASHLYFRLKEISSCENILSKIRGSIKLQKKKKKRKKERNMWNSSLIKEWLHKPAEIQWNTTETLPEKLKKKIIGLFPTRYYPPEITKMYGIAIFGVL